MTINKLPIVAIVGRANVGKSSIFNRLVGNRQTIVADEPGTTRDAIYGRVILDKGAFIVIDTAGLKIANDEFEASIQDQIAEATEAADVILVVIDSTTILTDEDRQVAKLAHKSQKPIILAINKADNRTNIDEVEFLKLGIKDMVKTSTTQNQGFIELINLLTQHIKPIKSKNDDTLNIAIIGRPNVGKSSIFNALAKKQQAVIADQAGTTRDVNRIDINYQKQHLVIMDTAGIRRPGKIERGVEKFSVIRAIQAIEEADICLLILDANELGVSLDQKLAGMIKDAGKGLILVISKWDTFDKDPYSFDKLSARLKQEFQHVPWAPFIVTSAIYGQNIAKLFEHIMEINSQRLVELKTNDLNKWLSSATTHHPPAGFKHVHPKLKYVTQTGQNPPEFTIFGTGTRVLHWSYKRYLEKDMRFKFGFAGTPIILKFRDK